jgi:hypothetical protein
MMSYEVAGVMPHTNIAAVSASDGRGQPIAATTNATSTAPRWNHRDEKQVDPDAWPVRCMEVLLRRECARSKAARIRV